MTKCGDPLYLPYKRFQESTKLFENIIATSERISSQSICFGLFLRRTFFPFLLRLISSNQLRWNFSDSFPPKGIQSDAILGKNWFQSQIHYIYLNLYWIDKSFLSSSVNLCNLTELPGLKIWCFCLMNHFSENDNFSQKDTFFQIIKKRMRIEAPILELVSNSTLFCQTKLFCTNKIKVHTEYKQSPKT